MLAKAFCYKCKKNFEFTPNPDEVRKNQPYEVRCTFCNTLTFARLE